MTNDTRMLYVWQMMKYIRYINVATNGTKKWNGMYMIPKLNWYDKWYEDVIVEWQLIPESYMVWQIIPECYIGMTNDIRMLY